MIVVRRAQVASRGLIAVLLFAAILAVVPVERAVRGRIANAATELLALLETRTGLRFRYSSLSPSLLRSISLGRFEIMSPSGSSWIRARRAFAYYDLGALATGRFSDVLSGISLEFAEARIDKQDLGYFERLFRGESSAEASLPWMEITARSLELSLTGFSAAPIEVALRSLRYRGSEVEPFIETEGSASFVIPEVGRTVSPFAISGLVGRNLGVARLKLELAASSPLFDLKSQRFEFTYGSNSLELRRLGDEEAMDATIRYDISSRIVAFSLAADGFSPASLISLRGKLSFFTPWLAVAYRGALSAEAPVDRLLSLRYAGEIEGILPESLLPGPYFARIEATGDLKRADIAFAGLDGPMGNFSYAGGLRFNDLSPDGLFKAALIIPAVPFPLSVSARLYGGNGRYAALLEETKVGDLTLKDIVLDADIGSEGIDFNISLRLPYEGEFIAFPSMYAGEAAASSGASRIRVEGSLSLVEKPLLEFAASLESVDFRSLGPLARMLIPAPAALVLESIMAEGDVYVRTDFSRISFSTTDLAVVSSSLPGSYARVSASGDQDSVKLRRVRLSYSGTAATGSGELFYGDLGNLRFSLAVETGGVPYSLDGSLIGDFLVAEGDYGLSLAGRFSEGAAFFSAKATELPLPAAGAVAIVSFSVDGQYASPESWRLAVSSLDVDPAGSTFGGIKVPRLTLSGLFGPAGGDLSALSLEDAIAKITGSGAVRYSLASPFSINGQVSLEGGGESYLVEAAYDTDGLEAKIIAKGSRLDRIWKGPITGRIDASAEIFGKLTEPNIAFSGELKDGSYNGEPLTLSLKAAYADSTVSLKSLRSRWRGFELSGGAGFLDIVSGRGGASGFFRAATGADTASFGFKIAGESGQPLGDEKAPLDIALLFSRYKISGFFDSFFFSGFDYENWPFTLEMNPEFTIFEGGEERAIFARVTKGGVFEAVASTSPLSFNARGRVTSDSIEAEISGIAIDLPFALTLLPDLPFVTKSGRLAGVLSVRGKLAEPEISGALDVNGLVATVPGWLNAPVGPVDAPVVVDGRRISVSSPSVRVGTGRAALRADFLLSSNNLEEVRGTVKSLPNAPIPIASRLLGIGVEGSADADIELKFSDNVFGIRGALTLQKSEVLLSPEMFYRGESGTSSDVSVEVDLAIGVGRGVRVFFPYKDVPIVAGNADPSSRLQIVYDQRRGKLTLQGLAVLRGGDVFYVDRSFFLKSASIVFNENYTKFSPLVTLHAELRDATSNGPVLVTLRTENAPIQGFKPRMTADPTMTETEIATLLGANLFGVDVESGEGLDVRKVAIAGSEFIQQLNVVKTFENRIREALGVDVFYIRTQAIRKILYGISGVEEGKDIVKFQDYLDQTIIYAGAYISPAVFAHASARISEDPLVPIIGLRLDSEFGVEFETPFGLLEWKVQPEHYDSLFVNDQSIGLSWRLSF